MRKFIKTKICILLSITIFISGCSAFSGEETALDPKNPVVVTLWHYYAGDNKLQIEKAVDEFNQTVGIEKGVIIDSVGKGSLSDLETELSAAANGDLNAEAMPDIFSSYRDKLIEIDSLDLVADLKEYFKEEDIDKYIPGFINDGYTDDGRLINIPIVKSTEVLYMNQTAYDKYVSEAGGDISKMSTWEDLFDTARNYYKYTDALSPETMWDGNGFIGIDVVANFVIIGCKQLGVEIIDGNEGVINIDKTALRKIFDFYYNGTVLGYVDAVGKFRADDIKSGELVSYIGSSSGASYFPTWIEHDNTQVPIKFMALSYPIFEGRDVVSVQQGAGMSIAKSTPAKQEGAALFLKWLTQPERNIDFSLATGYLPVEKSSFESEGFNQKLDELAKGDEIQQNVSKVYNISYNQIISGETYALNPFVGSYEIRSMLDDSLTEIAIEGKEEAEKFKAQGMSEEEILQAIDVDAKFDSWIEIIKQTADEFDVTYIEK